MNGLNDIFYYRESLLVDKEEIPLALLLGWAGSNDKHVLKYAQIYENMGYHTIRISPTVRLSVFQSHLHKEFAFKLLELIKAKPHLNKSPIIVHTFSNTGTFFYRYVTEILNETTTNEYSYLKKNLKTIIYDSGPGKTKNNVKMVKAVAELVNNSVKSKFLAYLITFFGFFIFALKLAISRSNFFDKNMEALIKDKLEVPILAFCSKADDFVCYNQIIEFLNRRKKFSPNLKIETVLFDDSAHCMHYLMHETIYLIKIKQHLASLNIATYEINQ